MSSCISRTVMVRSASKQSPVDCILVRRRSRRGLGQFAHPRLSSDTPGQGVGDAWVLLGTHDRAVQAPTVTTVAAASVSGQTAPGDGSDTGWAAERCTSFIDTSSLNPTRRSRRCQERPLVTEWVSKRAGSP
jgi:hypothetical protein